MEKFAIDLDKVLDDFEFNEDCAEQIAAVSCASGSSTTSGIKCSSSSSLKGHNSHIVDPANTSKGFEVMSNFEKHKDPRQISIENRPLLTEKDLGTGNLNYSKGDSTLENVDSVNRFYPLDCVNENKVMHKQCVQAQDLEQVSLTIYNDISQKLLQKQQNGDTSPKIQNTYDKKLNQPNIKPSVSNVFNSLNEYINAPTVNLSYVDTMLDKQEARPKKQSDTYGIVPTKNSVKECNLTKNVSADGITCMESEEKDDSVSHSKNPHYDNISVPLSLPLHIQGKKDLKEPESLESICSMDCSRTESKAQHDTTVLPQSTTSVFEHRYENICPGSSMQGIEPFNIQIDKLDSQTLEHASSNVKHIYENVSLDENKVDRRSDKEPSMYQNVYIKKQDTLQDSKTQTTTYKVSDYIPPKEFETEKHSCMHTAKQISSQSGSSTSQPDASSKHAHPIQQVHKPVGIGHIDDLSEEELTTYLAELEAEEALREENLSYQNIALPEVHNKPSSTIDTFQFQQDDEDADEAPIFESVMIGELPSVSEEELQEKAKKFPIIDYSKGSVVGRETLSDFLEKPSQEKPQDLTKPVCIVKGNKEKVKRSKKLGDDAVINLGCTTENISHNENVSSVQEILAKNKNLSMVGTVSVNESVPESSFLQESQSTIIESQMMYDTFNSIPADKNVTEERTLFCTSLNNEEQSGLQENRTNDIDSHVETLSNDLEPTVTNGKQSESNVDIDKPVRPQTLDIVLTVDMDEHNAPGHDPGSQERVDIEANKENGQAPSEPSPDISDNSFIESGTILGKQPPFWIPDGDASSCMLCDVKFTVLKRRHHCRACGKVLCNKCCNMKFRLEYQGNIDSRVCVPCHELLIKAENGQTMGEWPSGYTSNTATSDINSPQGRQPNPNNPMEYCSTIPPLQQLAGGLPPPPTVMVPVGVLKREGSTKQRPEGSKSVMFSDGIRPGCDLTELDTSWDLKAPYRKSGSKRISTSGSNGPANTMKRQNIPPLDSTTNSYIPQDSTLLPPTVTIHKGQVSYHTVTDLALLYKTLKNECEPPVMFAINRNLYAYVKITNLNCCVNKVCWNITSRGLACVGQDEVILLVETLPDENHIPKDLLIYINQIYIEAIKGNTITELGFSVFQGEDLLGSREHAGFLFIRQTLQCLQKIVLPPAPFLVGLLIHRWETPWAKIFPLRLILRLGAEYRYYPCPLVSVRFRNALYFEIGHTVMKLLADFRNYGYTLPGVRGLTIHLKNRTTDVMFPRNRYDQVIKGLNNSNDHVLAYASNFSITADSHLVCIQTNTGDESNYQTQAINIHNKPRTVTGASFIVINGALKSSMGLSAKSSIVEDGLMVEIMPEKMEALKAALKNMQDFSIGCGRQGAPDPDETVNIKWIDNDTQFNLGVRSPIDGLLMDGIPSIRVHNGIDYKGTSRIIRWTEVFIIKSDDHPNAVHDPVDINKLSENIARATCAALVKLLDLLATAGLTKLGVRTTIHPDNVGYEAGSEGTKLPPIYMNSLDNELIQVLHKAAQSNQDTCTVLELIFYILDD